MQELAEILSLVTENPTVASLIPTGVVTWLLLQTRRDLAQSRKRENEIVERLISVLEANHTAMTVMNAAQQRLQKP